MTPAGQVQFINPDALIKNPAFSNVIVVTGSVKTVYVGGQDAVDASGTIIGKGDFKAQTEQVLKNIQAALSASGVQLEHVIRGTFTLCRGSLFRQALKSSSGFGVADRTHLLLRWRSWLAWQTTTF